MAEYAEHEVIKGCLKKDRKYEEYLYKKYYSMFLAVCARYGRDMQDARQLLNDGFVRIFMQIGTYKNEGSFEGWMRKVMINTCLEYLKSSYFKKGSVTVHDEQLDESSMGAAYNNAISNMDYNELIAMLQGLPAVSRTVFNLFVFEENSHAEIAALLNITAGTSAWHVHHARAMLQQMITTRNRRYEHK